MPTEVKVTEILKRNMWGVHNEYPFFEDETKINRTIDMKANKYMDIKTKIKDAEELTFKCNLYIECKKSSTNTWVFYTQSMPDSYLDYRIYRLANDITEKTFSTAVRLYSENKIKVKGNLYSKIPMTFEKIRYRIALSHQNIFSSKDKGKDDFHDAKMKLLKVLKYDDEKFIENGNELFIIPIIIFNGNVYEYFNFGGEQKINKLDYIRYLTHTMDNAFPILIDIVTLDYLAGYLVNLEDELETHKKKFQA